MLDFVLGAVLLVLAVHGWRRGLVSEASGLAIVVVGGVVAVRISRPVGRLISDRFDTSPDPTRLVIGVLLFATSTLAVVLFRWLWLPPRRDNDIWLHRLAASGIALLKGAIVVGLLLAAAAMAQTPGPLASAIDTSTLAADLVDPDRPLQQFVGIVGGDRVVRRALRLREHTGSVRLGDPGESTVDIATAMPARPGLDAAASENLLDAINRARVLNGEAPLTPAAALARIAEEHGTAMYDGGWFAHVDALGHDPGDRLDAADIPHIAVAELLGIGLSEASLVNGWKANPEAASVLYQANVTKAGVAVVNGPLGQLAVVLLTG